MEKEDAVEERVAEAVPVEEIMVEEDAIEDAATEKDAIKEDSVEEDAIEEAVAEEGGVEIKVVIKGEVSDESSAVEAVTTKRDELVEDATIGGEAVVGRELSVEKSTDGEVFEENAVEGNSAVVKSVVTGEEDAAEGTVFEVAVVEEEIEAEVTEVEGDGIAVENTVIKEGTTPGIDGAPPSVLLDTILDVPSAELDVSKIAEFELPAKAPVSETVKSVETLLLTVTGDGVPGCESLAAVEGSGIVLVLVVRSVDEATGKNVAVPVATVVVVVGDTVAGVRLSGSVGVEKESSGESVVEDKICEALLDMIGALVTTKPLVVSLDVETEVIVVAGFSVWKLELSGAAALLVKSDSVLLGSGSLELEKLLSDATSCEDVRIPMVAEVIMVFERVAVEEKLLEIDEDTKVPLDTTEITSRAELLVLSLDNEVEIVDVVRLSVRAFELAGTAVLLVVELDPVSLDSRSRPLVEAKVVDPVSKDVPAVVVVVPKVSIFAVVISELKGKLLLSELVLIVLGLVLLFTEELPSSVGEESCVDEAVTALPEIVFKIEVSELSADESCDEGF